MTTPEPAAGPLVVKVGGSLYDLPDLAARLRRWLTTLTTREVVLVPGGGAPADAVRRWDELHGLGEEQAHWLALRALTLNAHFLAALVPGAVVVAQIAELVTCWQQERLPVLDPFPVALADEGRPGCLPHSWTVTSDSLAARVAVLLGATQLVLLKSVGIPSTMTWREAGENGRVDPYFALVAQGHLRVRAVNLRGEA